MADDWLGISSAELDSFCGEDGSHILTDALDGDEYWSHEANEVHWFIIDLGATYTIKKVRGRSDRDQDPIDVDIYVSDSKTVWGAAVATGISTWQDTTSWVEADTTDKDGRYIKVVINDTEQVSNYIQFGDFPFITIFDAYGDVVAPAAQNISEAGAIASLEAFGTHQLNMAMSTAGAIASLEAFGAPQLNLRIAPSAIASLEALGTPVVVGPITCTGIASLEAFGTPQLNLTIFPSAIASLEAFGTSQLNLTLIASAIASLEAFGTPQLNLTIFPSAIASLEAFGTPVVAGPITCTGIASLEAFGTPQLNLTIFPSAIASLEAFGTPTLILYQYLLPSSIASLEAFGTPQLNLTIFPSAIASAEAFGLASVIIRVYPAGALGYIIEVRDSSDNLLAFLQNAHGINLVEQLNRPPMLDFRLPADDSKISHISPDNEYWLRNYETGVLVRKFLLSRRRDTRD